jgi:hypothetical protein
MCWHGCHCASFFVIAIFLCLDFLLFYLFGVFFCLLGHVNHFMLGEHFGSMCLISALTTQSLTCNIKSKKGVNNAAKNKPENKKSTGLTTL